MGDGVGGGGGGAFARAHVHLQTRLRISGMTAPIAYSHKPGMYVSPANTRNYCTCMPHLNVHPHIGTS